MQEIVIEPDGSARIKLSRRDGTHSWAVVDVADLPVAQQYHWHEARRSNTTYVEATPRINGKRVKVYLHRLLADAPGGAHVDHEDGDGRNNRRSNIRAATVSQNRQNEIEVREHTCEYKGASWSDAASAWTARIGLGGGHHRYLGVYDTAIEAALAYDAAARRHFGEFARTNFTEEEAASMPLPQRRPRRSRENLPHGRGRYTNYGCRCEVCRAAESAYQRARRQRAGAA